MAIKVQSVEEAVKVAREFVEDYKDFQDARKDGHWGRPEYTDYLWDRLMGPTARKYRTILNQEAVIRFEIPEIWYAELDLKNPTGIYGYEIRKVPIRWTFGSLKRRETNRILLASL